MFVAWSYPWTRLLVPQQRTGFQEYNFHTRIHGQVLFNTQRWFVSKNRISADTCLPIRFLEAVYMSQYDSNLSILVAPTWNIGHP
jgi:hypothetical protein